MQFQGLVQGNSLLTARRAGSSCSSVRPGSREEDVLTFFGSTWPVLPQRGPHLKNGRSYSHNWGPAHDPPWHRGFTFAIPGSVTAEWLFHQEKATLHYVGKRHVNCGTAFCLAPRSSAQHLARLTKSRRNAPGNCLLRIETVRVPENREKRENEAKMPMKIRLKQVENAYNTHTMSLAKMNIC